MFALFKPKKQHIWKETKRENLGKFWCWGRDIYDARYIYRIAVYEECLLTGEKCIREIHSSSPIKDES
jgi:hypothetical protein